MKHLLLTLSVGLLLLTAACSNHFPGYVSPTPMYTTGVTTYDTAYVAPSAEDIAAFNEIREQVRAPLFTPDKGSTAKYLDADGHLVGCVSAALAVEAAIGGEIYAYWPTSRPGTQTDAFHAVVVKDGVEWNTNYNGPARFKTSNYNLVHKLDLDAMKADADAHREATL